MRRLSQGQVFRTSFFFGLFQFLMPILGWLAGRTLVQVIAAYDHWVAFGLLALVGGRMVWESFKRDDGQSEGTDISRGFVLLTLSVATSIDALAVGLSFAVLKIMIMWASLVIGLVAFGVTASGFWLGRRTGKFVGKRAKLLGGIIPIGIGLRILLTSIFQQ